MGGVNTYASFSCHCGNGIFDWFSFKYLKIAPRGDHFKCNFIYRKNLQKTVKKKVSGNTLQNIYSIRGQLFFASVQDFMNDFDNVKEGSRLVIDFTKVRIWDYSGPGAVDKLVA